MPILESLLLTAGILAAPLPAMDQAATVGASANPAGAPAPLPSDTLFALGRFHGVSDAREVSTRGDFLRGFGWGLLAGPVGGIVAVRRASSAELPLPDARRHSLRELGGEYRSGYRDGFEILYPDRRREATIAGAMVGSLAFAFVVLQVTDLPGRSRFEGQLPDGEPTFLRVTIPLSR